MTETTTDLAMRPGGALAVGSDQTTWTEQQLAVLRSAGVNEQVTAAELSAFLHECQRTKLDPFSKQIYLIGRWDDQLQRKVFRSQTGIDGYRVVAHRVVREEAKELEYEDTVWCGPDGKWRDVWLAEKPPAAAKVVIYKGGKRYSAVATLAEYAARKKDGSPMPMWRRMPANQLEKCAEAKALRRAFPNDLGGIYTAEEMEQADAQQDQTADAVVRKAQREQPAQRAADENDPSTNRQRTKLIMLVRDKRGITDDAQQRAILGELLGRQVASRKDITFGEASRAIETLDAETDFIADAETVPDAPPDVQNRLLVLLEQRLDMTDHDDRMAWITGELNRHVATAADLTLPEATGLIERLEATEPPAQPWDNQPQVPPAGGAEAAAQAKAAVQQDMAQQRDGSWSHQMLADRGAPLTTKADGSDQMFEDMAIAIADATDPNELEGLYLAAKHAHEAGKLTAAQFGKLDQLGRAQNEDLRARAGSGVHA